MIKFPSSHPTADIVLRAQWAYIAETWGLRVLNIQNPTVLKSGFFLKTRFHLALPGSRTRRSAIPKARLLLIDEHKRPAAKAGLFLTMRITLRLRSIL